MTKRIKIRRYLVAIFAALAVVLSGAMSHSASAAEIPEYRLQVSPSQANLGTLEQGKTYTGMFNVQNTGQKTYSFETEIKPYSVSGGKYEPNFTEESKYTIMRDWITIENGEGEVQPGEQREVTYKITVPEDAPSGNQNASIVVRMLDDEPIDSTGIKTIQQISFIMFSNVAGETRKTAEIIENKVPGFLFEPPVVATSVVKNTGNIYTTAKYVLEVTSFFGGKQVYVTPEKESLQVLFPEVERYNEVAWTNAPQLGLFKVKQTITVFDEESTTESLVFLCPIWFLVLVIIFIALAVFWLVSRLLKRKQ